MLRLVAAALLVGGLPAGCAAGGVERCLVHERLENARCEPVCEVGERVLANGRCEPICGRGEVLVGEDCELSCPVGEEHFAGECVPECGPDEQRVAGTCTGPRAVRVNSVGYPLVSTKLAVIDREPGAVQLRSREDESVVVELDTTGPSRDPVTGLELWRTDFSAVIEPGRYFVHSERAGESPDFVIARRPFASALELGMLGFYGLRCGTDVEFHHHGETFAHEECHAGDGFEALGKSTRLAASGGWHDAGDYGKYTLNGAFAAGILLLAWEHFQPALQALELPAIPEHGGPLPDYLAEVKWQLDWLLRMQLADGSTYHKLTARAFEGFVMPEQDISQRYMAPVSSEATASFVAVMAMAARVYEPFDEGFAAECLAAAERGRGFLTDHPDHVSPDLSEFATGQYKSDDQDDRLWAAAETWVTTGDVTALAEFESRAMGTTVRDDWDWSELGNLGVFSYVLATRSGKSEALELALEAEVLASAERLREGTDRDPFLRALGDTYYWGANGLVARSISNLAVAHRLSGNDEYRRAGLHQLDHLLGLNVQGRSFVTGLGFLPPLEPHHRPSGADFVEPPWPGLLVGGPNPQLPQDDANVGLVVPDPDAPAPLLWQDHQLSYWSNEVAVNWNAPLVYGLAWFTPP